MTHFTLAPETPDDEWRRRTASERPLDEAMGDPVWRIANLYTIYSKKAKKFVPFVPKPEQRVIIWDIFVRGIKNLIIPKARQIGFSTLLAIIAFDLTMWCAGVKCALVDKTKEDGMKKFQDIVRVAWDRLSEGEKGVFDTPVLNQTEFAVKLRESPEDGWSRFRVEKSGRGDALVFLWISEWGTIQFEEPKRSTEILTGGMLAAEGGIRVIETTWKGGEDGDVWAFVEKALGKPDSEKEQGDWFLRFFPWWVERSYTSTGDVLAIPKHLTYYLNDKEEEISALMGRTFTFTSGQRLWYAEQASTLKLFIKREFPTTLQECWEAPVDDAIYAEEFATALAESRVRSGVYDDRLPVYTTWDLGAPQNTVVWYFQVTSGRLKWIDVDMKLMLTPRARVERMRAKPYKYAKHFMPHDADHTDATTLSFRGEMTAAGLDNIVVVPVTKDIELGISKVNEMFPHFEFDKDNCAPAFLSVKQYHRHPETKEPVHDWASHPCDALRVAGEASAAGLINLDIAMLPAHQHLCWFDGEALDWFAHRAFEWTSRMSTGVIENEAWVKKDAPQSWLRVWEDPCEGQSYLVALVPGEVGPALGVWRRGDTEKRRHGEGGSYLPILCAALMPDLRADLDQVSRWCSAVSRRYGRCLVVPAIDDASGLVALLDADGAGPVWMREKTEEHRTPGRGRSARKPGFEMTTTALGQILATLRGRVRERGMEIGAPEFADEARHFIEGKPGDLPHAAPGHGEAWVRMCALAAHCIERATVMSTPAVPEMRPGGHTGNNAGVRVVSDWGESES